MTATLDTQTYFAKTVEYLRTQAEQCTDETGACSLTDWKGNRCAIGYWIPDGHPSLSQTGGSAVATLSRLHPDLAGKAWPDSTKGLMLGESLQRLHDLRSCRNASGGGLSVQGEERASEIAVGFDLVYTPPQN